MDNYNATLKALRNSIYTTRINQGDCELAYELEMWTKILDGVIASREAFYKKLDDQDNAIYDHFAEHANAEVHAIQSRERE
jgi:hypothetical protein